MAAAGQPGEDAALYDTVRAVALELCPALGISIPVFVLGLTLQYIFAVQLKVLPASGRLDFSLRFDSPTNFLLIDSLVARRFDVFVDAARHLVLPAIALGSIPLAIITRITRASVLDVSNEDYVRTARAKGLTYGRVDSRHIMRNAWLPVVSGLVGSATTYYFTKERS